MSWNKYTSIDAPEKVQEMLGERVWLTEKVDGSNFSIHVDSEGNVTFHSRSQRLSPDQGGQFSAAIAMAQDIVPRILNHPSTCADCTLYFEFFGHGIQRRIQYTSDQSKRLVLIDIKQSGVYLDYGQMWRVGTDLQLAVVPAYNHGTGPVPLTSGLVEAIRKSEDPFNRSIVADRINEQETEGVVVRMEDESTDARGNRLICKIKSFNFVGREHKSPKRLSGPKETIPNEVIEWSAQVVTVDRLSSVYSHGGFEPEYAMADMRHLVRLIPADIKAEGHEDIYGNHPESMINKVISKRLPGVLQQFLESRLGAE